MSVTHPSSVRTGLADFVVDQLDGGTLVLLASDGSIVAELMLASPAFGPSVNGVAYARTIEDAIAIGGIVAKAEVRNSAGTVKIQCSVSEPGNGGDIELPSLEVSPGQTVSISSLTYTASA